MIAHHYEAPQLSPCLRVDFIIHLFILWKSRWRWDYFLRRAVYWHAMSRVYESRNISDLVEICSTNRNSWHDKHEAISGETTLPISSLLFLWFPKSIQAIHTTIEKSYALNLHNITRKTTRRVKRRQSWSALHMMSFFYQSMQTIFNFTCRITFHLYLSNHLSLNISILKDGIYLLFRSRSRALGFLQPKKRFISQKSTT